MSQQEDWMSQQDRYEAAAVCSSLKTVAAMLGGTAVTARARRPVLQDWLCDLTLMQQSVVISAIRGCDGVPKRHKAKPLVRWYRRCVLLSAFDGKALTDPFAPGGGSFTGPVAGPPPAPFPEGGELLKGWKSDVMRGVVGDFVDSRDELPAHYFTHAMHAFEVLGYKHPDADIRKFWHDLYVRLVHTAHAWPETEEQMDARLGDDETSWRARGDESSCCSD